MDSIGDIEENNLQAEPFFITSSFKQMSVMLWKLSFFFFLCVCAAGKKISLLKNVSYYFFSTSETVPHWILYHW